MQATTLSCRCRFCGFVMCYSHEDVGHDARCSHCGQSIRLPGKLASVAVIRRVRRRDRAGLALEIGSFVPMPFFFPWGLFAGAILLFIGWRRSTMLVCGNCDTPLQDPSRADCPACRSKFGSE